MKRPRMMRVSLSSSQILSLFCIVLLCHVATCFVIKKSPLLPGGRVPRIITTRTITPRNLPPLFDSGVNDQQQQARILQEKADQLRREIESFEDSKREQKRKYNEEQQAILKEKQDIRERYSAQVPILKSDGSVVMERCDFPPRLVSSKENNEKKKQSRIITVQANLPLGIVLGQREDMSGFTTVDEVAQGSNGELAGVKVGDLLRACTATQVTMEMPTWQLMAGGIGRPKTTRMMFSTDGVSFETVMEALVSNSMDPEGRPAWLVLERMDE
jgi:hypothetical protein